MDSDALVRRVAVAALPLLAVAVWLLRSEPEQAGEGAAPTASASPSSASGSEPASADPSSAPVSEASSSASPVDGPRAAQPTTGPSVDELAEAAKRLDETRPEREVRRETPQPKARRPRKRPTTVSAVDLPVAEPESAPGSNSRSGKKSRLPTGPCGGLQVHAITDSKDPEWAFATIAAGPDEPAHLRRIGDSVGSWKVVDIEWDRVWLSQGGGRCAVGMHAGVREAQAEVAAAGISNDEMLGDAEEPPPAWHVPQTIADAIARVSVTEYTIERSAVDAIYDSASDLLAGVTLDPVERGERVVGIELGKVPVDSLLERLGLQTGDIVLAVGDEPCITLQDTIAALESVRSNDEVVFRVERQGQAFELSIRVI